jgi:glycosyltransferase involved in cell wall biosynthesis
MDRLKIVHISKELGIGGCNRNIVAICEDMDRTFCHSVVALYKSGPYEERLREIGVGIRILNGDLRLTREVLREEDADVVLLHRAGKAERDWCLVLRECREARVKAVLEYNVFGLPDLSPEDEYIDMHLHKSKTSYLQFVQRARKAGYGRVDRHRVLYNAVQVQRWRQWLLSGEERLFYRKELGLDPESFVLLRVGRPDVRKWSDFLMEAMPLIADRIPKARMVFVGIPASRRRWIQRQRWSSACVVLENTSDDRRLAILYQLADVLIHSSRRGETFPNTILEAFAFGLPAVVNNTPWRDNSQIEIVDHMVNGVVVNTPEDCAEAVALLHREPDVRRSMGAAALEKAQIYAAARVTRALGRLIVELLHRNGHAVDALLEASRAWEVYPSREELEVYPEEYQRRLKAAWSTSPPEKGGTAFRRLRWIARDVIDILGYKLRRGVDSKWI